MLLLGEDRPVAGWRDHPWRSTGGGLTVSSGPEGQHSSEQGRTVGSVSAGEIFRRGRGEQCSGWLEGGEVSSAVGGITREGAAGLSGPEGRRVYE